MRLFPSRSTTLNPGLAASLLLLLPAAAQPAPEAVTAPAGTTDLSLVKNAPPILPPTLQAWFDSSRVRILGGPEGGIVKLRLTALLGENPALRRGAEAWVAEMEKQLTSSDKAHEKRVALRHAKLILNRPWGEPAGLTPLLQSCVTALKRETPAKPAFGSLESRPYLTFCVLNEIAVMTFSPKGLTKTPNAGLLPDAALWREALELLLTHPLTKDYSIDRYKLFQISMAVEGLITESTLEKFLNSPFDDLSGFTAKVYRARGDSERLAELGMSLKPRPQLNALEVLASDGTRPDYVDPFATGVPAITDEIRKEKRAVGPQERKFWQQVFQAQPLEASARFLSLRPSEIVDYPSALESVRSAIAKELQSKPLEDNDFEIANNHADPFLPVDWSGGAKDPRFEYLEDGLNFLTRTPDSRNVQLLRTLLGFRGYVDGGVENEDGEEKIAWQTRHFRIRKLAAEALRKIGEPVPDGLVFETKVKLPPPDDGWHHNDIMSQVKSPAPNVELPPHVAAEPGKLSLFADYGHLDSKGVPLYMVNRTSQTITVPSSEFGRLNIHLERQLPTGEWEYAARPIFLMCGLGSRSRSLPPGMFYTFLGFQPSPKHGLPSTIRFVSHEGLSLVSNPGSGLFYPEEMTKSWRDQHSLDEVPYGIKKGFHDPYVHDAPDLSGCIACLKMAELVGEVPGLRASAQSWLSKLEEFPDPTAEESQAIAMAKTILARDWGEPKGLGRLLKGCLDALKTDPEATREFGSLAQSPQLVWTVVGEIAGIDTKPARFGTPPKVLDRKLWRDVLDLSVEQAIKAQPNERYQILTALRWNILADEILPDEPFERLLQLDDEQVTRTAAAALVRRSQWENLAELAIKMPNDRKVITTLAMAENAIPLRDLGRMMFGGSSPRKPGPREEELWQQVVKTLPLQLAAGLSGYKEPLLSAELLRNEVRAYWQTELKRNEASEKDFELIKEEAKLAYSLDFLARSRLSEDIELLRSLLAHRGYMKGTGTYLPSGKTKQEPCETRRFTVRGAAAQALRELNQTVPNGLVYEVLVKPVGGPL